MQEFDNCSNCGGEVSTDSDFCPHCGFLFGTRASVFCESHAEKKAVGVCIICRAIVCGECSSKRSGRLLCRSHANVEVQEDWAKVFEATDIYQAGLMKSVLEQAGFAVQVQNFNSIGFVWDGGGDSAISRSNLSKPAKVFVPIPDYIKAHETLRAWDESEFSDEATRGNP